MSSGNPLGEYLRARREVTSPKRLGVTSSGRRRTPGLRREEVAQLSGISTDYYTRLEQGREQHPSGQVLDAVARTLGLDPEETRHLHLLGRTGHGPARPVVRATVRPSLLRLMDGWAHTPALIIDRTMDVLAGNRLGRALFAEVFAQEEPNLVRFVFLHPAARSFYPEWDQVAQSSLSALRAATGNVPDDPRLKELVGELSLKSPEFRRLWARHDVRGKSHDVKLFRHPEAGELTLTYESFTVDGASGQQLVVYQADPGSPSAQALATTRWSGLGDHALCRR
ncbi:helix-turn-helix transcriptional regulator [Micromonospora endophytica]|uniref:Transcriptional regulator n=1 Tax=Micromonospora endophytica TaxID=515350 RepID=A0A2W2CMA0_9ACTN|nr:helix-turn-helix transcriptional regulator [Micromonospora endophytica]PZG00566.1 transcriptional regulator [Micromonospora endophytica]RIW45832.1 XRE family transcriptional regulator [Micromonospora endophytica]BCJ61911.1 transcriptional regulator [Micromonospora endophytica]